MDQADLKSCSKCGVRHPRSQFYKHTRTADKLTSWCKGCYKVSRDAYYQENKERAAALSAVWREKNRESINEKRRAKKREDPRKTMYASAKHRARKGGIPFDIDLDDIVIPDECPVLRKPFDFGNTKQERMSPSLDKIDPTLGYVKGNIQVISWLANTMKNDATEEELMAFAQWVIGEYSDKESLQRD